MKIRKYKDSNNAVIGIVSAFLIIGLIVAVLSVIQTQYVPKWMREKEAEHMNEVADQFAQLKYAIDIHSKIKETDNPISTTITLGTKEMPYLMSVRSYGDLWIDKDNFKIEVNGSNNYTLPLGIIKFTSYNAYYLDQDFILEGGAVIISQNSGNTIHIKPSKFTARRGKENNVSLIFNLTNITTIGNKDKSVHGYGSTPIQTEFIKSYKIDEILNVKYINISTNYIYAWSTFLNSTLLKADLNSDLNNPNYEINLDTFNSKVIIKFFDNTKVKLKTNVIEIGAQIAPGWIEQ